MLYNSLNTTVTNQTKVIVYNNKQDNNMAEDKQAKSLTVTEAKQLLADKANSWINKFSGKVNHNPYLRVQQKIQPIVDQLCAKDAQVTPQIMAAIAALPDEPAVVNPAGVPAPVADKPVATPASVGAKNVPA